MRASQRISLFVLSSVLVATPAMAKGFWGTLWDILTTPSPTPPSSTTTTSPSYGSNGYGSNGYGNSNGYGSGTYYGGGYNSQPTPPPSYGGDAAPGYDVDCSSWDYKMGRCHLPERARDVKLDSERSSTDCVEGSTWGHDNDSIWVKDGCRASFHVKPETQPEYVNCSSWDHKHNRCNFEGGIHDVQLDDQHSDSDCVEGVNWGHDGDSIWVKDGCRATFKVRPGH